MFFINSNGVNIIMQTIYQDDAFSIKTYHNIPEDDVEQQNIDFWLIIGDKTFLGSAFTLANIQYLMIEICHLWFGGTLTIVKSFCKTLFSILKRTNSVSDC